MNELMIIQDATCWNNIAVDCFGATQFLMINMMMFASHVDHATAKKFCVKIDIKLLPNMI